MSAVTGGWHAEDDSADDSEDKTLQMARKISDFSGKVGPIASLCALVPLTTSFCAPVAKAAGAASVASAIYIHHETGQSWRASILDVASEQIVDKALTLPLKAFKFATPVADDVAGTHIVDKALTLPLKAFKYARPVADDVVEVGRNAASAFGGYLKKGADVVKKAGKIGDLFD